MRWKTKPIPKLGETRWVKKFAWFPVETASGDSLWLESYYVKEVYCYGRPWYAEWAKIGWFGTQTVTPEQYDKVLQEELVLTAITASCNFTLEKAKLETLDALLYYDKEKK